MKLGPMWLLLAIALAGCSFEIDDTQANLTNATAGAVNAASDHLKVPSTATAVNYYWRSWQGSAEYAYFKDSTPAAHAFAQTFIGVVPPPRDFEMCCGGRVPPWWPEGPISNGRHQETSWTSNGYLEILIVDHESYSEVWASQIFP